MLASNPAWMLNHITPDLGIPDSVKSRHALAQSSPATQPNRRDPCRLAVSNASASLTAAAKPVFDSRRRTLVPRQSTELSHFERLHTSQRAPARERSHAAMPARPAASSSYCARPATPTAPTSRPFEMIGTPPPTRYILPGYIAIIPK
jgi:hypothetical protein